MRITVINRIYPVLVCLKVLMLTVFVQQASAQGSQALSESVYKALEGARSQMLNEQYEAAQTQVKEMLTDTKLSSYERSQALNLLAYNYYLQGDHHASIKAYEQVLQEAETAPAVQLSTWRTLAQLYFSVNSYPEALDFAARVQRKSPRLDAGLQVLIAHSHYQLQSYEAAIKSIETLINEHQPKHPEESWLIMLQASYQQLERYDQLATVVERLVALYPKKRHYLTLSSVYSQLEDHRKQLVVLETLYEQGMLDDEHHLKALATLYLQQALPLKAATLLEEALASKVLGASAETFKLIAQSWLLAREEEKALLILKQAQHEHEDMEILDMLARTQITKMYWGAAKETLKRLMSIEGADQSAARLMLGVCHLRQKEFDKAKLVLNEVVKQGQGIQRQQAAQWLDLLAKY